jgi:hypothetical protein
MSNGGPNTQLLEPYLDGPRSLQYLQNNLSLAKASVSGLMELQAIRYGVRSLVSTYRTWSNLLSTPLDALVPHLVLFNLTPSAEFFKPLLSQSNPVYDRGNLEQISFTSTLYPYTLRKNYPQGPLFFQIRGRIPEGAGFTSLAGGHTSELTRPNELFQFIDLTYANNHILVVLSDDVLGVRALEYGIHKKYPMVVLTTADLSIKMLYHWGQFQNVIRLGGAILSSAAPGGYGSSVDFTDLFLCAAAMSFKIYVPHIEYVAITAADLLRYLEQRHYLLERVKSGSLIFSL